MGRAAAAFAIFAAGLLTAVTFATPSPAAPEDCLPVVGCVSTTVPSVPLPPVTLPTLPTTPTDTSPGGSTPTPPPATTTTTIDTTSAFETSEPEATEAAFSAQASVRIRGRGVRRVVEIRVRLTSAATVNATLKQRGRALVKRRFSARAGSSLLRLRIGAAPKAGAAVLGLAYSTTRGDRAQRSYRIRLPR